MRQIKHPSKHMGSYMCATACSEFHIFGHVSAHFAGGDVTNSVQTPAIDILTGCVGSLV